MHLIEPKGRKRKWDIRLRIHDGRIVKIPGDRDEDTASRLGERIVMLVKAKAIGDPPPGELKSWINNMPEGLAERLIKLGLIPTRYRDRNIPLIDWIVPWVKAVAARKPDSKRHAPQQGNKVRRIVLAMQATSLDQLDSNEVEEKINGFQTDGHKKAKPISITTRRSYMVAIKHFSGWVARKMKIENPLENLKVPDQGEVREYERQPLTVAQFQTLMVYLDTFERYRNQKSRWTAYDRKIIYWTAVSTGYRESEMKKLRKWNFQLDAKPPVITLKPRDSKTKTKGKVPIRGDLAAALRKYIAHLEPDDVVFPFPRTSGSIVDMLRRDLEGAGVPWKFPGGEVFDFHAFRSTFITWALEVYGLTPKRVQILARLVSLHLVQNYSRNMRIGDYDWLQKGPNLVSEERQRLA